MATIDQLIELFTNSQNQANTANQERLDTIMGLLDNQGVSSKESAARNSAERTAAGDQSLMDRGLFNTTILDANRRREGENLDRQNTAIDESVALNKANLLERVSDIGPDSSAWLNLIQQLGLSQGSGSGGRSFSSSVNRPTGPIDPFGNSGGGGGGGYGGGGGGGSSGVQHFTNPNGNDPFANQSIQDAQAGAQGAANMQPGDPNLPVVPRYVWFDNPAYRIQGDYVYDARTGQLKGRKGN